jgi:hypothetical protein
VILVDAMLTLGAAVLLFRGSWRAGVATIVVLFFCNILAITYLSTGQAWRAPTGGHRRIWVLEIALVAAAIIRLILCIWEGFSVPAIGGSASGLLVGVMFIYIAARGGR